MLRIVAGLFLCIVALTTADARSIHGGGGFNGGKSQIGVNFLQIANDYAFMNAFKSANRWDYVDNSNIPDPTELSTNGYPIPGANAFSHGGVKAVFFVPTQAERPGNYVATWDGISDLYLGMNNTLVSGSKTGSSATGNRYVFSTTDSGFIAGFSAATQTPSNLKIFHVNDETEINAGEILGKQFRQNWAYMNAGVIRFGDWMPMNTTNQSTWATRKPVNYAFYTGEEFRLSMWGGDTTNVGNAYTATITPTGWAGLVDKATVIVRFNASATSDSATLNVGGTGAIVIRDWYGDATSVGGNTRPVATKMGTLVYDAQLNAWLKSGGDAATSSTGLQNGVPPEVMLQVATKLRAHPYVTTPYLAADPITDYMPSFATYIRDNGPSWMIPRFETPNETWNSASGFFATRYAWNKAFLYWPAGGTFNQNDWIGKAGSLLGQSISVVYSGNRARYQVLAGVQSGSGCGNAACSTSATSNSDTRLTSAAWVAAGTPTQSGYTVSAAYNWVTHVAFANYSTPTAYGTLQELKDGYAYVVTNSGNPSAQATLADAYADTLGGASAIYNMNWVKAMAQKWYAWAQGNWGGSINLPLTAYEGGYSPDYSNSVWTSPITGATRANPCVLTLATTDNNRAGGISGNPAVIGMQVSIASVAGMTQLNGNTYTVTAVAGNSVTINVDASAFTAYTSGGTASYVNSPLYVNTLRYAGKFSTHLQTQMTQHYTDMASVPVVFPSQFNFSGSSDNGSGVIGSSGQVWGLYDPSVYATPYSPAVESIRLFNQ